MTANETTTKRRPRRASPKKSAAAAPSFDFPDLDTIIRMSQEQVEESFRELNVTPRPFHWSENDQANVAFHAPMGSNGQADLKQLKVDALANYHGCQRTELLAAYLTHWVESLETAQLVDEIERMTNTEMSESAVRYAKREDLREELKGLSWPTLIAASTLYTAPTNPLDGAKETK